MSDTTAGLDLSASTIEGAVLWLPDIRASLTAGSSRISGKTFRDCRLEGPALVLVLDGVHFEACDFGYTGGEMGNILFRSVSGSKVIGAIPFADCRFERCSFFAVAFTGTEPFLQSMLQVPTAAPAPG